VARPFALQQMTPQNIPARMELLYSRPGTTALLPRPGYSSLNLSRYHWWWERARGIRLAAVYKKKAAPAARRSLDVINAGY
jgi:hypothetical protein